MFEIILLVLALALIFGLYVIVKSIKTFAINAVMGLVILYLANALLHLGIGYSWIVILICALGGVLGAVLVIALHYLGIIF